MLGKWGHDFDDFFSTYPNKTTKKSVTGNKKPN